MAAGARAWCAGADVVRYVPGLRPPPPFPACAAQSIPHPVQRWVRPPAAAASSLPPRSLATPPAAHARTHLLPPLRQDGRAVDAGQQGEARPVVPAPLQPPRRTSVVATSAVTCEATATAGCRLGPALAAPPLARRWTAAASPRGSVERAVAPLLPPPRKIYLRND